MNNTQGNYLLPEELAICDDPATSYWLANQIAESYDRDIVDSIRDCEVLLRVLKIRYEKILEEEAQI